jgi:hypothetical protein
MQCRLIRQECKTHKLIMTFLGRLRIGSLARAEVST